MAIDPRLEPRTMTIIGDIVFDKLVVQLYGRPYRFQQQGDAKAQDSFEEFSVPYIGSYYDEDHPNLVRWLATEPPSKDEERDWIREYYPPFEEVINDLAERGILDPGDYALHISW